MPETLLAWEPHDMPGEVGMIKTLDSKLPGTYATLFGIDVPTLGKVHDYSLMAQFLGTCSSKAEEGAHSVNEYEGKFFRGPDGTDMSTFPPAAVYGASPTICPANMMGFIRTLREKLAANDNWTDAIGKDVTQIGRAHV